MVTITVIALIVFGPKRLPEIARKAGAALRELRSAAQELKSGIEAEYEETLQPLDEARRAIRSALDETQDPGPRAGPGEPERAESAAPRDEPGDAGTTAPDAT
jgi:TatA/E family protein of Tat protein translocase